MNTRRLINYLSHRYPRTGSSFPGDRFGLQIGKLPECISGVVVGLDLNDELIDLALAHQCSLILTHHPTMYPIKRIALRDARIARLYERAIRHHLTVYSFHTNFDASATGMNAGMLEQIGAQNIRRINPQVTTYVAELPHPLPLESAVTLITHQLDVPFTQCWTSSKGPLLVHRIALCAGSGTSEWEAAYQAGADLFISGDSRHHLRLAMEDAGLHFLELHHEAEDLFIAFLAKTIRQWSSDMIVVEGPRSRYPSIIR